VDKTLDIPFHKVSGRNGALFNYHEAPLFARIRTNLVVAMHDSVEFKLQDPQGKTLSQLGKVVNLFFLEATQSICAQIQREPDKQMLSLDISQIFKNDTVENEFLQA
jgi:hypothetical protein